MILAKRPFILQSTVQMLSSHSYCIDYSGLSSGIKSSTWNKHLSPGYFLIDFLGEAPNYEAPITVETFLVKPRSLAFPGKLLTFYILSQWKIFSLFLKRIVVCLGK